MDVYSVYNQIPIYGLNEKYTTFVKDWGLYYYKVMPFGVKNTRIRYQRLVKKMFAD